MCEYVLHTIFAIKLLTICAINPPPNCHFILQYYSMVRIYLTQYRKILLSDIKTLNSQNLIMNAKRLFQQCITYITPVLMIICNILHI